MKKNNANSQLQWVILLLVVAVVLPAVCLLWFMGQAMKNESFAIKQKLINSYTNKAKKILNEDVINYWQKQIDEFTDLINTAKNNNIEAALIANKTLFDSAIIIDANNEICWPTYSVDKPKEQKSELEDARQTEFVGQDYSKAAQLYSAFVDSNEVDISCLAMQGQARCLKKAGKLSEAAKIYEKLAWPGDKKSLCNNMIVNNRLMLLGLYRSLAHENFFNEAQKQVTDIGDGLFKLDSETQFFYLSALSKICKEAGIEARLKSFDKINKIIKVDELALETAQDRTSVFSKNWQQKRFREIASAGDISVIYNKIGNKKIIALIEKEKLTKYFQSIIDKIDDEMVFAKLLEGERKLVNDQLSFLLSLGNFFPDLKIEIRFRDDVFSSATGRQLSTYAWIASIVLTLMIGVVFFTVKAILEQARINKLKNDFIATVTHELKTPLASTRLLVDTLIDGNYQDSKTADEYLRLISKENQRLTHLIDNFLTFSRMERNKQAFDMTATSPTAIAESAADAMVTKFNNGGKCEFDMEIEKGLPEVYVDKDAMVTVLVNLLDNAYKYSYDEKQITLRVFKADNGICFAVKDNGIGMNKRQTKKIFDRFYQADNSLARKAEGTGLGLSIVKFIVDAHKGKIEVKSQPGKGSEFIISLSL